MDLDLKGEGGVFFFNFPVFVCHATKNVHGDLQANYRKHPLAMF